MRNSLPVLAAAAVAPLLALATQATLPAHAAGMLRAGAVAALPHNLCASCHGGARVAASRAVLDARELAATRTYLQVSPEG